MDFYRIGTKETKQGYEVFPNFEVERSKDLLIRAKSFYAIWDEELGLWNTDSYRVPQIVDAELVAYASDNIPEPYTVKTLRSFGSQMWERFLKFCSTQADSDIVLDQNLTFANTEVKKEDYVSRRLPYALAPGDISAWDELVGTLYNVEERRKIEWAIGAIVSGDSKKIQKFLVLYGPAGAGKSTILNVVSSLFEGYVSSFEAKALGSNNNQFSTESFKSNPLVAIQHDGDLSKIEDNTKLNSIVSHEMMTINEKYKASYSARINAFLFMGTNQPVKISDSKSGLLRRLIDVAPTGVKIPSRRYQTLISQIDFELGAIAQHCLEVYREHGKNYYNAYRPTEMMWQTDIFYNYIEHYYDVFKEQNGVSLKQGYDLYKQFCEDTGIDKPLPQYKFRAELESYFDVWHDRYEIDGIKYRGYFTGFNANKFKQATDEGGTELVLEETVSLFDSLYSAQPAQYATDAGTPKQKWDEVTTTLADLNTNLEHYVLMPEDHIVIDFDLEDENGNKSLAANLAAASEFPETYGEVSRSGAGVHLHYRYAGDSSRLSSHFSRGIEVKRYAGRSALRRKLTHCNRTPVKSIEGGLPLKEEKVLSDKTISSEKGLRDLIERNLKKEIHAGTKPSVDFIAKILQDAYDSGMNYDVTDLRPRIVAFANNSTNQPLQALKVVQKMPWKSAENAPGVTEVMTDPRLVFFDVEVYSNLFVICWKYEGDANVVRMVNPSAQDVEALFGLRLVGFNNRRYDNHIMYARYMGYSNEQLFQLSTKLINNDRNASFGEAYGLSWTDVWDYSSKKQGLKKFGIELKMHHVELDIPFDQPAPEETWDKVVEYCVNDVLLTEAVHNSRKGDYQARLILAELSGLSANDTTQKHTARIIFGKDTDYAKDFVYTDLSIEFPGYTFDLGKSHYRGEEPGEGGYVYAEPGIYSNVALLDIASMHPTSIEKLNLFGPYTENFSSLKEARLAIKHKDYEKAGTLLQGRLKPYLSDVNDAEALSYALKIIINIVYGLTSAKFDNPFRDIRNVDNIVAKRGALFMIDLKNAIQEQGWKVIHIKTDSVKIPNVTEEMINFVTMFGEKYGYDFEMEKVYDKLCLVNDAVYVAKEAECVVGCWTAVGAQFQHPYVFKQLFTGEDVEFDDLCESKSVIQGAMYLDFEGSTAPGAQGRVFVGRTGRFTPVVSGGARLVRIKDDKEYAVSGTKGWQWVESEMASTLAGQLQIDMGYFDKLANDARTAIAKYGDVDAFLE